MEDKIVYVNFEEGVKRVMGNAQLFVKLLAKFKNDTNMEEMSSSLAAGDMEKARTHAHAVKGIAANLALSELFREILELENQLKAGAADAGQIEKVKSVFTGTVQEIDRVITQYG